jgi:hypothetical protein
MRVLKGILTQHACFACRKVFKRPEEYLPLDKKGVRPTPTPRQCPHWGGQTVYMGPKFRAPAMDDVDEWARIDRALKEARDYGIPTVRKQKPTKAFTPNAHRTWRLWKASTEERSLTRLEATSDTLKTKFSTEIQGVF